MTLLEKNLSLWYKFSMIIGKINSLGHLEIGGCDTVDLADEFGTPLYVVDKTIIKNSIRAYKNALFGFPHQVVFASKALCVKNILQLMEEEGLGIDVTSGGELYTALKAGCNPENIFFHGNNKSRNELEEAITAKIGRIVVDNEAEFFLLKELSVKKKTAVNLLFRFSPGISAHTHEFIQTGQEDSKFGLSAEQISSFIKEAKKYSFIKVKGLHSHIGSQIFEVKPYMFLIHKLVDLRKKIYEELKVELEELNIGGGLGIKYVNEDDPPAIEEFVFKIREEFETAVHKFGLSLPKLILEPGRSLVGLSGVTLYRVGTIKEIKGIRKYVMVDGGMADNPRPIIYGAKYSALIANKADKIKNETVTIAGRYCESGDVLIKDISLPNPQTNDVIAVFSTGAYNYTMASNYNRVPRPAMVSVENGKTQLIVRRETYEDLVRNDL